MNVQKNTNVSKKVFKCQICKEKIEYKGRGRYPKFCKNCAKVRKNLQTKMVVYEKRRKLDLRRHSLGTTNLFEHRHTQFGAEYNIIRKEIYKLGFKRQFS